MIWILILIAIAVFYFFIFKPLRQLNNREDSTPRETDRKMRLLPTKIEDEWHFVITKGAELEDQFYEELENLLEPQIESLDLESGYLRIGSPFSRGRVMHYSKYGKYFSLTCAESFGINLNISWYLYFAGIFPFSESEVIAFSTVGKDCAERVTKATLAQHEEPEKVRSGSLGDT